MAAAYKCFINMHTTFSQTVKNMHATTNINLRKKKNCKVIFQPNLVYEFCSSSASAAAVAAPMFQLYGCLVNVKQQRTAGAYV